MREKKLTISRRSFQALIKNLFTNDIILFCHRYFGLSEDETKYILDEIIRQCWESCCENDQLLCRPRTFILKTAQAVAYEYLKNKRRLSALLTLGSLS